MFRPRIAHQRLRKLLRQFPIVAIVGARQVGKSTLARFALKDFDYFEYWTTHVISNGFGKIPSWVFQNSKKLVLDEAQRVPEVFPILRSHVDRHPASKIVMLGSASPNLSSQISESLTGRVGFLELSGVSILEEDQDELWMKGAYPRVHWGSPKVEAKEWYSAYLRTYLQQDIPQLGFRVTSRKLFDLITMVAHSQGSVCNLTELGGSMG